MGQEIVGNAERGLTVSGLSRSVLRSVRNGNILFPPARIPPPVGACRPSRQPYILRYSLTPDWSPGLFFSAYESKSLEKRVYKSYIGAYKNEIGVFENDITEVKNEIDVYKNEIGVPENVIDVYKNVNGVSENDIPV